MIDETHRLAEWLEGSPEQITLAERGVQFPVAARFLKESGIAKAVSGGDGAVCSRCDEPHPVDVDFDPWRKQWGYRCEVGGWAARAPDENSAHLVDISQFTKALANAVGANTETRRVLIEDQFYCLGVAGGGSPWTALFARGLADARVFEAVLREMKRPIGKEPGLLITSSTIARTIDLPSDFRVAWLWEAVELTDAGLSARPGLDQLGFAGRRPRRKTGPVSLKAEARAYFESRHRHRLSKTDEEEVAAVVAEMKARHPGAKLPSTRHIRYDWLGDLLP
jgi:hypothetical protein